MRRIRVAIADDSAFIRKALVRILEADRRLVVVGTATCGEELLDHLDEWAPDVISLDLSMPGIGGLRTLDRIMEQRPTPVIILSTHAREDAPLTIEALHRGAVDFIDKQRYSLVDFQSLSRILIERILEIAGKDEVPRSSVSQDETGPEAPGAPARLAATEASKSFSHDLLIIAASTGGPIAIQTVLEGLAPKPPVPIVLIQHMPPDFTGAFAERLNNHLPFAVRHASDGELLLHGTAYVAPGGYQLQFKKTRLGLAAVVTEDSMSQEHSPSADVTFASAAEAVGSRVLATILTGMGKDGAHGLARLTDQGAHAIAQDRKSSIIFGMPRAAIERGGVADVLPLHEIGPRLSELLRAEIVEPASTK
ncbi:MAG: chemotaxis-specific protein-glutamate methyltransferase CheB [bacterium]|nr:chemotaxis-specific protein-glutamate methyltransferase CheB [bacterium]